MAGAGAAVPGEQATQEEISEPPRSGLCVPVEQATQTETPSPYLPVSQAEQVGVTSSPRVLPDRHAGRHSYEKAGPSMACPVLANVSRAAPWNPVDQY